MLRKYYRSTIEHVRFILCLKDLFIFYVYQCSREREREEKKREETRNIGSNWEKLHN